jgi:hypothetical protein
MVSVFMQPTYRVTRTLSFGIAGELSSFMVAFGTAMLDVPALARQKLTSGFGGGNSIETWPETEMFVLHWPGADGRRWSSGNACPKTPCLWNDGFVDF